jgi:hypothetical protein
MSDSDHLAEQVHSEMAVEALEETVAALASENASILKALYKIAADSWNKYGSWAESVARAELKKHGLKTPPERE